MSLTAFLAENAERIENVEYVASQRFKGEDGKPVPWEIRCITSEEDEKLRRKCIRSVPVPWKRQQYQKETDFDMYLVRLAAACTVFPNLKDAELQNSYHAMGEEELQTRMLPAGEYADYVRKVQEVCGFEQGFEEEKEEAKN